MDIPISSTCLHVKVLTLKLSTSSLLSVRSSKCFLFSGADINGQAGDGASPLFEACKNGHDSVVQELLSLEADANRATKSGLLPLHVAVQNGHTRSEPKDLPSLDFSHHSTNNSLSITKNNTTPQSDRFLLFSRIVLMLIPVTSRVSVQRSGISPLHIAAERNKDEILELLIQYGFDVNAKLSQHHYVMYKDRRSTALYFSVYNGNLEASEMLLKAGANPNVDVFNPLLIAVCHGWLDMAELLLRYGADVNTQISTPPSSFPSVVLLNMESLPMLKLLLDNGCNARPCFDCLYGQKRHPPITSSRWPVDEMQVSGNMPPQCCIQVSLEISSTNPCLCVCVCVRQIVSSILFQFCEAVSSVSLHHLSGLIISMLLDYVGHVHLCSRLTEILESRSDWALIKLKACKEQVFFSYEFVHLSAGSCPRKGVFKRCRRKM